VVVDVPGTWKQWLGIGGLLLLMLLVLLYIFGEYAVSRFVEPRIRRALLPRVRVEDVHFQLLPMGIRIDDPETEITPPDAPPVHLQAEHVRINPTWTSLWGDTVTIDSLEFEGLTLDLFLAGAPPRVGAGVDPIPSPGDDEAAGGIPTRFLIREISVTDGRVRFYESADTAADSLLSLQPVELRAGPLSPGRLRRGLPIRVETGLGSSGRGLTFDGQIARADHVGVNGTLSAHSLSPSALAPLLPSALRVEGGILDATVPLRADPGGLHVENVQLVLRDATMGWVPSETSGEPVGASPAAGETPFPVSMGESRIRLENVRLRVPGGEARTLDVREGALEVGSLFPAASGVPLRGEFSLSQPEGLLEFTASLDRTAPEFRVNRLLAGARVDDVKQLNPYLQKYVPMTFREGSMTGGARGSVWTSRLNVNVELSFRNLKAAPGKSPDSTFLGVPVSLLLRQLARKDGSLELSFRVTGSMSNPKVDVSRIRQRLLLKLGVDAALLNSLGLPVYVGSTVLEKTTGIDVLGKVREVLGDLTAPDGRLPPPPSRQTTRGTTVPSPGSASPSPSEPSP